MTNGKSPCGFCRTGHHHLCPGQIASATASDRDGDRTWVCPCAAAGHQQAEVKAAA